MLQEKLHKRIRNLLDMAADTVSPHEAVIAAKRARSLMDKYGVKESDLKIDGAIGEYVCGGLKFIREPVWVQWLSVSVARWNDCHTKFHHEGNREYSTVFLGFIADAIVASHAFEYLVATVYRLCDRESFATRGESYQFKKYASSAICRRIRKLSEARVSSVRTRSGQQLVPMKLEMVEQRFGVVKYSSNKSTRDPTDEELEAARRGDEEGKKVGLDKQLKGHQQKHLK